MLTEATSDMGLRPFTKGVSGNPSGRPRGFAEFTELCRQKSAAAIARIEALAKSKDKTIRLHANKVIIERAWGKPVTPIVDASGLAADSFVVRSPTTIPDASAWERTIVLEQGGSTKASSKTHRRPPALEWRAS